MWNVMMHEAKIGDPHLGRNFLGDSPSQIICHLLDLQKGNVFEKKSQLPMVVLVSYPVLKKEIDANNNGWSELIDLSHGVFHIHLEHLNWYCKS